MKIQTQTSALRKMGFLEKITALFHELSAGSSSVAAMIKVDTIIEFEKFKKAWQVLFQRQPLLRTTIQIKEQDYFLNFNAKFGNIPLKHIKSNDFADVMREYGCDVIKPYNFKLFLWRATLVILENEHCSYIVLGALHTICDAKSISYMLGDLLRIMQEIDNSGVVPHTKSLPIPSALDLILDRTKFVQLKTTPIPLNSQLFFEDKTLPDTAQSSNILKILNADVFINLLCTCRKYNVTITSALCAALAISINESKDVSQLEFNIPFDLRQYTNPPTSNQILAFYAHQVVCSLDLTETIDFWGIAKQAKKKYQKAINEYTLQSANNYQLFSYLSANIKANFMTGQFLVPYTISNVGVVDDFFTELNDKYTVKHFSFTIRNQGLLGLWVSAATLNNNLYLNFNFSSPALSEQSALRLAERTIFHITHNIVC